MLTTKLHSEDSHAVLDFTSSSSLDQLTDLEKTYAGKVKELEVIEDKFNQCVAIIPETDENAIKLTTEI
jgi:hypothetical protein